MLCLQRRRSAPWYLCAFKVTTGFLHMFTRCEAQTRSHNMGQITAPSTKRLAAAHLEQRGER